MDVKGWKDVAYDVLCCPHGNTYQGRIDTINGTGANGTRISNASHMAVMALIGEGEIPTPALYAAVKEGIKLCQARGAGSQITGHNTFEATDCPGPALLAWLKAGMPTDAVMEDIIMAEVLTTTLRYGSKGTEVALLQKMLNGLIEANLTTDGSFGTATETKVKDFQTYNGLVVDGIVGAASRTVLNRDWATYVAATTAPAPTPTPEPTPTPTPEPTPTPDPVEAILASKGMQNTTDLIAAAKATGVPLWIAAAFAQKESNGRNVYGNDVGGTFAGAGEVTEENFAEFYRLVVDNKQKSNGVGPMQITYPAYFPQAKAEGLALWKPYDNFLFGLRIVARNLGGDYSKESLEKAGTLYNKGNLITGINAYGTDLAIKAEIWKGLLAEFIEPTPTPEPTPEPTPDPVVDTPVPPVVVSPEIDLDALADAVVAKIIQRLSA